MNDTPKVIAHRGASTNAPENTLSAFELAWKEGADGVECDVRLTADGEVICLHDADTERVGNRTLVAEESSLEALQALDVGTWKGSEFAGTRIPLLREVMAVVPPGKKIFIEVKSGEAIVAPLFEVIEASAIELKQIALMAFDESMVRALKARRPEIKVYWLHDPGSNWLGRTKLKLGNVLDTLVDLDADGLGLREHAGIDRKIVKAILEADVDLNIWTVDKAEDARRYNSLGVSSISTNGPRATLDAILRRT
jgi:glycerophosphoryl diester phosphodiesterase